MAPPSWAGLTAIAFWDRVYDTARRVYDVDEYYDEDAQLTADAALHGHFQRGGRRPMPQLARLPVPGRGELIALGMFLSIDVVHPTGRIEWLHCDATDNIPLLWSERLKACFVYPRSRVGACEIQPTRQQRRLVSKWTGGRHRAQCSAPIEATAARVARVLPCLQTSYYSDKFSESKRWTEYIHHHERGVYAFIGPGAVPEAIMIRGGRLRLTPHGLEG